MAVSKATTKADVTKPAEDSKDEYAVVVSQFGSETTVPAGIVDALLDSGYKRK